MISTTLLKLFYKENCKLFLTILGILVLLFMGIAQLYTPNSILAISNALKPLPDGIKIAMGLNGEAKSLTDFLSIYYYSIIILAIPLIYTVIMANRSISKLVDNGNMAYILSTPNSRNKICLTGILFIISSITIVFMIVTVVGVFLCNAWYPNKLDVNKFILLNLGALLLHYTTSGISYFASCLFNDSASSLAFGAGLPISFLLLHMLSNINEDLSLLKYFTINTLFNAKSILKNEFVLNFLIMLLIGTAFYLLSILIFSKKDINA